MESSAESVSRNTMINPVLITIPPSTTVILMAMLSDF